MLREWRSVAGAVWLVSMFLAHAAPAAIQIEGVEDREFYADRVSFRVVPEAGHDVSARINGNPVAVGTTVLVADPDYYELEVTSRELSTGTEERLVVPFIVRASARGNSERGLPLSVPLPPIPSAAEEFAGAYLELVLPQAFPQGLEVPVVARVVDAEGNRVGVNGTVRASEFPNQDLQLLRGVGSLLLPAATAGGELYYTGRVASLESSAAVQVDAATMWTPVQGTISQPAAWPEGARIDVVGDLTVAAGATLTVGAGAIVRIAPAVEITVQGTLAVEGTLGRPVVFTPRSRAAPWGGILLGSSSSQATLTGAILTGSGADPDWFDNNPGSGSSHRDEQPLIHLSGGARATLVECFLIDNFGQAGHGEDSFLTLRRCLVQRCITTGQYNRGSVVVEDSALIEFPALGAPFEDDDNDGLYLTGGAHSLTRSLVGWALDDGVDAGSGSGGSVEVNGCWFESCYHEGMAWSEDRRPSVRDSVAINCGQGIECGFGSPRVDALRCLSTANLTGARFGDNYDWTYEGFLTVADSILIYNYRDVWGRAWDDWSVHLAQMDLRGNLLTAPDASFPENDVWDPAKDAARLVPFLPSPATRVGIGLATWSDTIDRDALGRGVPVRLSTFTTVPVSVEYSIESEDGLLENGVLEFEPGRTVRRLVPAIPDLDAPRAIAVTLSDPVGAELTGRRTVVSTGSLTLVPFGSVWSYSDEGADRGTSWCAAGFDDAAWDRGPAELGFGDGDETTVVDGGPSDDRHPTVYFRHVFDVADLGSIAALEARLVRDDGAVVYLNGRDLLRSNMPAGTVTFSTFAVAAVSGDDEEAPELYAFDPAFLVPGANVLAVEVHQANSTSSDMSFNLELVAQLSPSLGPRLRRGDANGDGTTDISDAVAVLFVLFRGIKTECEASIDINDSDTLEITDAIVLLDFLFRGGERPPPPFGACGEDPTPGTLTCDSQEACE